MRRQHFSHAKALESQVICFWSGGPSSTAQFFVVRVERAAARALVGLPRGGVAGEVEGGVQFVADGGVDGEGGGGIHGCFRDGVDWEGF